MPSLRRTVEIVNKDGSKSVLKIPKGPKGVKMSPQSQKWMAAIQKALDALLRNPKNIKRRVCDVLSSGGMIAPCVTALTIKRDEATGQLAEVNAFKARHAFDNSRLSRMKKAAGVEEHEPTASTTIDDMAFQMQIGREAHDKRESAALDIPDAYQTTEREEDAPKAYMHFPTILPEYDEDGEPLCIEFGGTWTWGEGPAGRAFQKRLHTALLKYGMVPAEDVPCLYTKHLPDGNDIDVTTIVDDLYVTEKFAGRAMIKDLRDFCKRELGGCKYTESPEKHAGYEIYRDPERGTISLSMARKIEEAAREWIPEYAGGQSRRATGLPGGAKLREMLTGLRMAPAEDRATRLGKSQKNFQKILGVMRFPEQRVFIGAAKKLLHLSRVQAYPPPEAEIASKGVLADMYDDRFMMKTFGGEITAEAERLCGHASAEYKMADGAPVELELIGDATHELDARSVFCLLLTRYGASIGHVLKGIHMHIGSSTEAEAYSTGKGGELVDQAHAIERAMGIKAAGPTFVGTDNKANALVGSGKATPSRLRHCLRRYRTFLERVQRKEVELGFVPDPENPSDFMSKWVSADKLGKSLEYAMNLRNSPGHPRAPR
jgi:hypothetical protein